jgi:hypothetical protein
MPLVGVAKVLADRGTPLTDAERVKMLGIIEARRKATRVGKGRRKNKKSRKTRRR